LAPLSTCSRAASSRKCSIALAGAEAYARYALSVNKAEIRRE
jgi:hypothetical protein